MKILKVWHFICFVFGFNSLTTLVKESYEVVYEKGNEIEPVGYLACVELRDLYPNETAIELKELREALHESFNRLEDPYGWRKKPEQIRSNDSKSNKIRRLSDSRWNGLSYGKQSR